jgi:hypothetical protein
MKQCHLDFLFFRFDSELSKVHEEVKTEKSVRERLQREKDELVSKNFTLEQDITVCHHF